MIATISRAHRYTGPGLVASARALAKTDIIVSLRRSSISGTDTTEIANTSDANTKPTAAHSSRNSMWVGDTIWPIMLRIVGNSVVEASAKSTTETLAQTIIRKVRIAAKNPIAPRLRFQQVIDAGRLAGSPRSRWRDSSYRPVH